MRIGFYDPYLDTIGGGERYVLTLASHWAKKHQVEIFWDDRKIKGQLEERLGLDLSRVQIVKNIFSPLSSFFSRIKNTSSYDLLFYLSDGSIPFTLAKRNILHFQVPFVGLKGKSVGNKIKLFRFQKIVCNSYFTKRFIDKTYGVKSLVVYPPVAVKKFKPLAKKNLILSVGRFTTHLHAKKQHILLEVFKKMIKRGLKGWELILVGGVLKGEGEYLERLKRESKGFPVRILGNISFEFLRKLYSQAKIYWQATGFGEDEESHPERMEHFGIATVEAMASGCVPVVFEGGGLREIVENNFGFLWQKKEELIEKTLLLVKNFSLWQKMAQKVQKRSWDFRLEVFFQKFDEIVK